MPQPSPGMTGVDPTTAIALGADPQSLYELQYRQMIAQALMQRAATPPTVENYGAMRSRVSPLQGLGSLASALMANKQMRQLGPMQSQVYGPMKDAFPLPGAQAAPDQPPTSAPGADPAAAGPPSGAPPVPGGSAPPPTQVRTGGGMNPLGLPPGLALQMYLKDPNKYGELIAGTPEWRTALAASGGDPRQAMAMLSAEAAKKGTLEGRPGQFMSGPGVPGGSMIAPDVSKGEQYVPDGQGGFRAVPIGDSSAIQAQRAGDLKAAQEGVTPHYEPDPFHPGQTHVVYPPRPTGAPPTAGAPGAASYFPPSPRAPNTAADLEQQKKGVESGMAYSDQLVKNADNATEVRRSLAELRNLAGAGGVSVSNPLKLELGSYLIAAGMDPDKVGKMLNTDVGALTAATKQTGSLALDSIHSMTSRGTNFDLQTFMRYNPNLNMATPEGFRRVTEFMDKRMQQEVAKQADFDQWSQEQPPNRWASGHAAHWLALQNKQIGAGTTNSRPPLSSFIRP